MSVDAYLLKLGNAAARILTGATGEVIRDTLKAFHDTIVELTEPEVEQAEAA